jgi:DNA-binding transcriptional LysR family regulator
MPTTLSLDPDLLRVFVLIAEGRSFTEAASLVGRTQSAVSMQVKRLEDLLGQPVFSRGKGGGVELTPHGQFLLGRAREILALNDEVITTFGSARPMIMPSVIFPRCCGTLPTAIRQSRSMCCANRPRS